MIAVSAASDGRFYRDADRAILGGVCAGLAAYLGFNLKTTRFLACVACLMAMPFAIVAYLAVVFLVPAVSSGETKISPERRSSRRRKRRKRRHESASVEVGKSSISEEINRRCQTMDERLVRLEKHVTSKRFQLEQELSRL